MVSDINIAIYNSIHYTLHEDTSWECVSVKVQVAYALVEIRTKLLVVSGTNYISIQMVPPMLRCPHTATPQNIWFEHDGPQNHLLSDLDGPAHLLLVTDHRFIDYFVL